VVFTSEFKDWATEIPEEFFRQILEEWKKFKLNKNASLKMKSFLNEDSQQLSVCDLSKSVAGEKQSDIHYGKT